MGDLLGSPRVAPLFPFYGRNFFHIYMEFIWSMIVFPGWVSCKGEEATPNGVRGWEVGGTHKGGESRAPTSDQDRRAFAGACATGDRWVV